MKPKKILLIGYYGMGNFGDELMARTLTSHLTGTFDLSLLSYTSAPLWLEEGLTPPVEIVPLAVKNVRRPASLLRDLGRLMRAIARSDAVVFGGGTFLFDTAVRPYRNLGFPLGITVFARSLRKRVAFLGIGLVPLHTALGRRMVTRVLSIADLITVRDEASRSLAQELLPARQQTKVYHTADLTFLPANYDLLTPVSAGASGRETSPTTIATIAFFGADILKEAYSSAEEAAYFSNLANALDRIVDAHPGAQIRFVAAQISKRRNDNKVNQMIVAAMKHRSSAQIVDLSQIGYDGAVDAIGNSDLVVSMRLHPIMVALQMSVPVVAIGLRSKLRQLMHECGLSSYVVAAEDASEPAQIASVIDRALLALDNDSYPDTTAAVESQRRRSLENLSLLLKMCGYPSQNSI